MDSEFKPPQTDDEFKSRAKNISATSAKAVIHSLQARREALVKSLDEEVRFYKRVLEELGESL